MGGQDALDREIHGSLHPGAITALLESIRAVGSGSLPSETHLAIARNASAALSAEAASVIMLDSRHDQLVFSAAVGDSSEQPVGKSFDADLGIAGHVTRTASPALVNDVSENRHFYSGIDGKTGFQTRQLICSLLQRGSETIGVIEVLNRRDDLPFTKLDVQVLSIFASLVVLGDISIGYASSCRFSLDTEVWDLRFSVGSDVESGRFPRRIAKGLSYYHQLVSQPHVDIPAIDLVRIANPLDPAHATISGEPIRESYSYQQSIDRAALYEIYRQSLNDAIDQAERIGDLTEVDLHRRELDWLRKRLRDDHSLRGKIRSLNDRSPQRRARESVRLALSRAREQMGVTMPNLATHLQQSVRSADYCFAYHPTDALPWEV